MDVNMIALANFIPALVNRRSEILEKTFCMVFLLGVVLLFCRANQEEFMIRPLTILALLLLFCRIITYYFRPDNLQI